MVPCISWYIVSVGMLYYLRLNNVSCDTEHSYIVPCVTEHWYIVSAEIEHWCIVSVVNERDLYERDLIPHLHGWLNVYH